MGAAAAKQAAEQAAAAQNAVKLAATDQAKISSLIEKLSQDLASTQVAVAEEVDRLKTSVASCELAVLQDATGPTREDVSLIAELRAEMVAALTCEFDAIARLDKRIWLLDQRIERRVNDLALQRPNVARGDDQSLSPRSRKGLLLADDRLS